MFDLSDTKDKIVNSVCLPQIQKEKCELGEGKVVE